MPRTLGLATTVFVALLLLGTAVPATAHPLVVEPAAREESSAAAPEVDFDPGSSRAFGALASTPPASGSVNPIPARSVPVDAVTVLCLVGLAVTATIARRRRGLAVVLAAVLAIIAFETGLHSVHHLGERHDPAPCAVASASIHVVAAEPGAAAFDLPTSPAFERPHPQSWMAPIPPALDPHESRGPPASVCA